MFEDGKPLFRRGPRGHPLSALERMTGGRELDSMAWAGESHTAHSFDPTETRT